MNKTREQIFNDFIKENQGLIKAKLECNTATLHITREEKEDILSKAYLRMYDSFDVSSPSTLLNYLGTIISNLAKDTARNYSRKVPSVSLHSVFEDDDKNAEYLHAPCIYQQINTIFALSEELSKIELEFLNKKLNDEISRANLGEYSKREYYKYAKNIQEKFEELIK